MSHLEDPCAYPHPECAMADGKERLQLTRALASRHIFMLSLAG
ncbi:amino acid permease [Pseudomonas aeruginosa]|nr:amino acid permease [Pseudomonas aeruginosa]